MKKNKILITVVLGMICCNVAHAAGGVGGLLPPPPSQNVAGGQQVMGQQNMAPVQGGNPSRGFSMWKRSDQRATGEQPQQRSFFGMGGKDLKRPCKDAATLAHKAQTCPEPTLKQAFMDASSKLNALCERKFMKNPVQEAKKTARKLRELGAKSNHGEVYQEIANSLDATADGITGTINNTVLNKANVMTQIQARQGGASNGLMQGASVQQQRPY